MSESIHLCETIQVAADKIDREKGIARDVKILGRKSANGREYSDRAFDDAVRLYDSAEVNVDHDRKEPHRERNFAEGFGTIHEPYAKKTGTLDEQGVFGRLDYLTKHPIVPLFLERVDRGMQIGLSHNADGKASRKGGRTVVESIQRVNSVDLVRNPATNKNLFESKGSAVSKTLKEILESNFPKTAASCGLLEMDGGALAAMPVDMPAAGDSEDQIWAAFKQAINAALDDDKMDTKATLKKIGDILKAYDKLTVSDSGGGAGAGTNDTTPTPESKGGSKPDPQLATLIESVKKLNARDEARSLMDEFGITADAALLESLTKLPDAKAMRELCERESKLRPARGKVKPLMESRITDTTPATYPKDVKEFAAALH